MKIRELLTDESKWIQGSTARDNHGHYVNPNSPDAIKFCLSGAVIRCYPFNDCNWKEVVYKLNKKLKCYGNNSIYPPYVVWNDLPSTTFSDVKRLVEELDI